MMPAVMIRAILFDFNGVLLDDEPVHFELFRQVLRDEGLDLTEEQYYRDVVALDDARAFAWMFGASGLRLPAPRLQELIEHKAQLYLARMRRQGYPFFPRAVKSVRQAASDGYVLGIVSGALRREIEEALEQENLLDLVECIVAAEDVQESKPHPEGYLRGLALLAGAVARRGAAPLTADQTVAFEDTVEGLAAAQAAGLRTVGIGQTLPAHSLAADWVVETIGDIDLPRMCAQLVRAEHGPSKGTGSSSRLP
jgi:HAD superfamily hydrolase (TIGR01509 family)